jgi:hypothetical protein
MQTEKSDTRTKAITRTVELSGLAEIMFDRYAGDNSTKLEWWQKIYQPEGSSVLCLPTLNLSSFLAAHNTNSAPKRLRDKRKYKDICNACLSFVAIYGPEEHPDMIPFLREGKPIITGPVGPSDKRDSISGLRLHRAVARLDKGIPNPKERAVLGLPWSLRFTLSILPNREIQEQEIRNLFEEGGLAIGLGTFRGVFGKFAVSFWE